MPPLMLPQKLPPGMVARMLGDERLAGTSRAHAEAMLGGSAEAPKPARTARGSR